MKDSDYEKLADAVNKHVAKAVLVIRKQYDPMIKQMQEQVTTLNSDVDDYLEMISLLETRIHDLEKSQQSNS